VSEDQNATALVTAFTAGGAAGVTVDINNVFLTSYENDVGASSGRFTLTGPIPDTYGLTTNGIVLSTGDAVDYGTGTNTVPDKTTDWGVAANDQMNSLLSPVTGSVSNFDATELFITFSVDAGVSNVSFIAVFGSEQFPSGPGVGGFAAYLNGTNMAVVAGTPVRSDHPDMAALEGTELNGVLAPGSNAVLVFTAPVTPGSSNNFLTVIIANSDTNQPDSTVYLAGFGAGGPSVVSSQTVDLAVTKIATPSPVGVGSNLTYTINVSNLGPNTATSVQLEDPLPAGATFVSVGTDAGTCTQANGVVTCDLGDLVGNSATNDTVTIQMTADIAGVLTNTVTVSSDESDDNPADNSDTAITTVTSGGGITNVVALHGEWQDVSVKCKTSNKEVTTCKIAGKLAIQTTGDTDVGATPIHIFVSDDAVLDAGDIQIKAFNSGKVKAGKIKIKNAGHPCKSCGDVTGKFLIAEFGDDTNNVVVFGPL